MWKVITWVSLVLSFTRGKSCFNNLLPFFECVNCFSRTDPV